MSPLPVDLLNSLFIRARGIHGLGRIQKSTMNLVEKRVDALGSEIEFYNGVPASRERELAITSWVAEVVDLDAIVTSMEAKVADLEIEILAKELLGHYLDSPVKVETFIGVSARAQPSVSITFGEALGELTMALLAPNGLTDPPELRGLIAHEVAHIEPTVRAKLCSMRRGLPRRGEVLAALFALSSLGPAFAWAVREFIRVTPRGYGSPSHAPMSLRTGVAHRSLAGVWDNLEVRMWIERLIQEGVTAAGKVPTTWQVELEACHDDLETAIPRLRALRVSEQTLLSVRGVGTETGLGSAVERVNAVCPL